MRPQSPPPTILVQSEVQSQDAQILQNTAKLDQSVLKYPSAAAPRPLHLGSTIGGNPLLKFLPTPLDSTSIHVDVIDILMFDHNDRQSKLGA